MSRLTCEGFNIIATHFLERSIPGHVCIISPFYLPTSGGKIEHARIEVSKHELLPDVYHALVVIESDMYFNTIVSPEDAHAYRGFTFRNHDDFNERILSPIFCRIHVRCRPAICSNGLIRSSKEPCGICFEPKEMHLMEQTCCGHMFCMPCLNKLASSTPDLKCPICRGTLKSGRFT